MFAHLLFFGLGPSGGYLRCFRLLRLDIGRLGRRAQTCHVSRLSSNFWIHFLGYLGLEKSGDINGPRLFRRRPGDGGRSRGLLSLFLRLRRGGHGRDIQSHSICGFGLRVLLGHRGLGSCHGRHHLLDLRLVIGLLLQFFRHLRGFWFFAAASFLRSLHLLPQLRYFFVLCGLLLLFFRFGGVVQFRCFCAFLRVFQCRLRFFHGRICVAVGFGSFCLRGLRIFQGLLRLRHSRKRNFLFPHRRLTVRGHFLFLFLDLVLPLFHLVSSCSIPFVLLVLVFGFLFFLFFSLVLVCPLSCSMHHPHPHGADHVETTRARPTPGHPQLQGGHHSAEATSPTELHHFFFGSDFYSSFF
mmetsp:Transcript_20860/g.52661  ORF Transcript_20860/g.52661 Transcript_20860/m.52661 type:complete len:354 (-) Transcript_20860:203-1264(-)